MKDDLIDQAAESRKRLRKSKPTIRETNLAYLAIILFCAFTAVCLPLLNGRASKNVFITLAVISLILSIPLFILGIKLSKKKNAFKCFYYLDFMFIALSIMFSILAVTTHFEITLKIGWAFLAAGILIALSALDILVLFAGKKERLLFSLTSLIFLAAAIAGGVILYKYDNTALGLPLFAYSWVMLFLHLTMLMYVCGGDGFFELMSLSYLIIGLIVLAIALVAISGDCDCGGCDCGDFGGGGGRRAKNRTGGLGELTSGGFNGQNK